MTSRNLIPLLLFFAAALFFPRGAASEDVFERARGAERIAVSGREYHNYNLLLRQEEAPSLPLINMGDILLEPGMYEGLALHPDLLERMYRDNMRLVFFIVELSPYFPPQRYDRLPWGRERNYAFFGNSFWRNPSRIRDIYRRVYRTASTDFNEQLRRVRIRREMEEAPEVFVFARLQRSGATSQWRNAWGWDYYYYFEGEEIYMP